MENQDQKEIRIVSLDALRGFTMFWIIGGDDLMLNIARMVNQKAFYQITSFFTEHVYWRGFHFYDLIFPMFLFIIGVSIPFSIQKKLEKGLSKKKLFFQILKRALVLFLLGLMMYGALDFKGLENIRIFGVLQRLAICYFIAALLFLFTKPWVQAVVFAVVLLGYWAIMALIPVPGFHPGTMSVQGNLAGYIDRSLFAPGQLLWKTWDPEGLLSTIPAVGTAILGVFTGLWLKTGMPKIVKMAVLIAAGAAFASLGYFWGFCFPIIKNLWTSSFVLFAGGWSLILLGFFYLLTDVAGWKKWAYPLVIIGKNPITIYVGQEIVDFYGISRYFLHGLMKYIPLPAGIIISFSVLVIKLLFLAVLDKYKVYFKV